MATQATYYLDAPSLSAATVIYDDINLTVVAADGYYSDGIISRQQSLGILLPQVSCPSCNNEFLVGFGGSYEDACNSLASGTVTGNDPVFCNSTTFTGAIFAAAATGTWYVAYDGYYLQVSVTNGNPVATVTSACTACSSNVRIDWYVGNQYGAQLIIFNSSMSEVLNVTSTAGSAQTGTIYIPNTAIPYTVRGQWVSGSGNIVEYNVCDMIGGGVIFNSGPIDNITGNVDYYASPTPIYALVQLTGNSVPPPSCPA